MWAVIPIKRLDQAKQRLAFVLTADQRRDLVQAMLRDVLAALAASRHLSGCLVVTGDPTVAGIAEGHGAEVLAETAVPINTTRDGLCSALDQARAHLVTRGARGMLVVPGDVPLITAESVDSVLRQHQSTADESDHASASDRVDAGQRPCVTIVSDRDGQGTNCLALTPSDIIDFAFGADSCQRHIEAGQRAGAVTTAIMPGSGSDTTAGAFGLDIDTAADVALLMQQGPGTHAVATCRSFGLDLAALQSATEAAGLGGAFATADTEAVAAKH